MTEQQPTPPNTSFQIRLPLLFAVTLAIGMFIGQKLPHYDRDITLFSRDASAGANGTVDEVLRYVEAQYVDTVDMAALKTQTLDFLLHELDPHSVYITPEEASAVEDDLKGEFVGIGVEFITVDDTIQVVTPLVGGPSETAGLLAGDKVIAINDAVVAGVKIDNGKVFNKLRGAKGTPVQLAILRGREKDVRNFTIVRDVIPVKSVDVAYMLDATTGYIKVNRFSAKTQQEFMEKLRTLTEEGKMQNLVLDLRGNPGGYIDAATELLSQLFANEKLLVYTKDREGERYEYKSSGRAQFNVQNIAVLIDEGSASASEIVAGAIQDWDRGWIIGRRSFGKGLVQNQYPLSDGGELRLTTARYYTPSGRSIQRAYKNNADYEREAEHRLSDGELSGLANIKLADSTKYYTGQGRVVYGGGGIIPDIFVPLDTAHTSTYFLALRGYLPQFVARWMESHDRSVFPADLPEFIQNYTVADATIDELVDYAAKQGTTRNASSLAKGRAELKIELKARIAKQLFKNEGLYRVLNSDDPVVAKALEVIRSGKNLK